jgi:hypothetical protein
MDESANNDELRLVVRRVLLDMLKPDRLSRAEDAVHSEARRPRAVEPRERELCVTLRGNERSIGLLEQALAGGDATLEVALDQWGPRARVRAERA